MTHMEAMAAIAQGVINISESTRYYDENGEPRDAETINSLARIEKGSRIHRGMEMIVVGEAKTIERLEVIKACLETFNRRAIEAAHKLVSAMIAERTDPHFGEG